MSISPRSTSIFRPTIVLAVLSLLVCGLLFPLLITGVAQVTLPYQANGELVQSNGRNVGSNLIAQEFKASVFFHPRNGSASGVDPDITVQEAYSQIPRVSASSGISFDQLKSLVDQNVDPVSRAIEVPYVNVLGLNLALIRAYPSAYASFV